MMQDGGRNLLEYPVRRRSPHKPDWLRVLILAAWSFGGSWLVMLSLYIASIFWFGREAFRVIEAAFVVGVAGSVCGAIVYFVCLTASEIRASKRR